LTFLLLQVAAVAVALVAVAARVDIEHLLELLVGGQMLKASYL
jgi:hypothetical protein